MPRFSSYSKKKREIQLVVENNFPSDFTLQEIWLRKEDMDFIALSGSEIESAIIMGNYFGENIQYELKSSNKEEISDIIHQLPNLGFECFSIRF